MHIRKARRGNAPIFAHERVLSDTVVWFLDCHREAFEPQAFSSLYDAAKRRNWVRLLELAEIDGIVYPSASLHCVRLQLEALVKKYPFPKLPGFDPEAKARESFCAAERRCRRINQRFRARRKRARESDRALPYQGELTRMRRFIFKVLGESPNLPEIYDECDFGGGASLGVHGNATHIGRKLLAESWTVTPLASTLSLHAMYHNHHIRDYVFRTGEWDGIRSYDVRTFKEAVAKRLRMVNHNALSFVPKTVKTHRVIAVEPLLNGFIQKGVDQVMRRKLCRFGIDLRRQEPNQLLALSGSRDAGSNPFATIDLSSASDSISVELVRELLPPEWFDLLNRLRSHRYSMDGSCSQYEKFVSMGNGFCFPLETLIFAAACEACYSDEYRVYGDDIIVRQERALYVIELLRYLGFRTNNNKTFVFGPFRESCGAQWYGGQDVRPVYLRTLLSGLPEIFSLHNRLGERWGYDLVSLLDLPSRVPREWRFMRPVTGNPLGAFTVSQDTFLCCPHVRYDRYMQTWTWRELSLRSIRDRMLDRVEEDTPQAKRRFSDQDVEFVEYLAFLRGGTSQQPLTLRRKTKARVSRLLTHSASTIDFVDNPWLRSLT